MSHDLYLYSSFEEFPLVGNPDADSSGLGRALVFGGNAGTVVGWYARYCRDLGWDAATWEGRAYLESSCLANNDRYTLAPEWAVPDLVDRHIAMVDAFLAFAPGAKFTAS